MNKQRVPIILGIACLVIIGAGYFSPSFSIETIQPNPEPVLNPESLKEVMIFGASGTLGDGMLKALLMDKNIHKIQVITRRLTCRISINPVQPHLINLDSYKPSDYKDVCPVYAILFLVDKVFCNYYDGNSYCGNLKSA